MPIGPRSKSMTRNIPWGGRIEGKVLLRCVKCDHEWWYTLEEGGEIICEVIGGECPGCGKITGNSVLEWRSSRTLDTWFR